jgi:hypothetical protein
VSESKFTFTDLFLSNETWQKVRKPIISTSLFCLLYSFILYLLLPNEVIARLLEPFQKFLSFFCLYQGYGVFSPTPSIRNSHMVAIVFYEDGASRLFALPRLNRVSLLNKLTEERYRKFLEDNLPNPSNSSIVDDVARFVARKCDVFRSADGGSRNSPKLVILANYYSDVPPIHQQKPNPRHFNVKVLCSYRVTEDDLK